MMIHIYITHGDLYLNVCVYMYRGGGQEAFGKEANSAPTKALPLSFLPIQVFDIPVQVAAGNEL
jgi:hypothetical protein